MAGQSGYHLMTFFSRLQPIIEAARSAGKRVFLLAHSMGNWGLQAAVESWFSHGNGQAMLFDEIILAAADERYDTFEFPNRVASAACTVLVVAFRFTTAAPTKFSKLVRL